MREPAMPPLEFLLDASTASLQDLELAALNRSANLGRAAKTEIHEWIEQSAIAMLARWMLDNREALLKAQALQERVDVVDFLEEQKRKKSA